jgi:hypothetical protein
VKLGRDKRTGGDMSKLNKGPGWGDEMKQMWVAASLPRRENGVFGLGEERAGTEQFLENRNGPFSSGKKS